MPRPLFRKTTDELEALFQQCRHSPEQLRILAEELAHRERPKAVALRREVEAALAQPQSVSEVPATVSESGTEPDNKQSRPMRTAPNSTARPASFEQFVPPEQFTLVQPLGTRPRPSAYRPELQNDVRLDISEGDPPVKVFRVALAELIREMKRRRISHQSFSLEDGQRIATEAGGFSYQFEFAEDANIFEGAKVELAVEGRVLTAYLTGILQGCIIITLQENLGEEIPFCVLRIDNTALLQALHDRLEKIENGEVSGFRAEFAACVLRNAGSELPRQIVDRWPWRQTPTANQRGFVELALANEISWLWGPPGTGKTDTLSALTRLFYEAGKRVLVCSNTNQAVDQLLHKLCTKMQETDDSTLEEGRVLRLGRIEDQLEKDFGEFIIADRIVERRSADLVRRKQDIESELERLGREVAHAEEVLRHFTQRDEQKRKVEEAERTLYSQQTELKGCEHSLATAQSKLAELNVELQQQQQAGSVGRLFKRSEARIRRELVAQQSRVISAQKTRDAAKQKLDASETNYGRASAALIDAEASVAGEDRAFNENLVAEYDAKRQPLRDELASIAAKLEDIRNTVLQEARIVGATVTRTFLRPTEFSSFDAVIVDEASMILLPAVFQTVGLATERVVIAGDFQQLPPIVQTQQRSIHDVLAHDIFEEAGITIDTVQGGKTPRLVMLDEQFRMHDSICRVVSSAFYGALLKTHLDRPSREFAEPEPMTQRITIVDTSRIWPFTTRNVFNSRFNLMHALAIRNLILHLNGRKRLLSESGKGRIGICTPYAAQAKLLREICRAHELDNATVRASTVHGFQGDEREFIILDLVDSIGERNVGIFLQAEARGEDGAKLQNVALSRAQEGLVIFANLTFLDQKLPSAAILRGILHDLQRFARIVDVRDILALYPILDDLKRFGSQPELDPECLRTGLFRGHDFAKLCRLDMENAKKFIVVFSGFITPERAARMGDLFRQKIQQGVKVRCVTRPPNRNGSIPEDLGKSALSSLEAIGVVIDLRHEIHEKVVLIDNRIAWFGSLNPLSHTAHTSEIMARVDNAGVATHIASMLALRPRSPEDFENGAGVQPENPRCEECGGWGSLIRGRHGLFFGCPSGCRWTQNPDNSRRRRRR